MLTAVRYSYKPMVDERENGLTPVRLAPTRALAEEWALVLEAEGMAPEIRSLGDEFVLLVGSDDAHRAVNALWAYESENRPAPTPFVHDWTGRGPFLTAVGIAAAMLIFFIVGIFTEPVLHWYERGSASAERILHGEFWRTVTALTLHADFAHVIANSIAAVFLLTAAGTVLGPGVAVALVVATGATGNLLNAMLHGWSHVSVGASTAIFGAVGLLGGIGAARRRGRGIRGRRAWVPLVASVALLAMIGTSGPRVDLWAHFLGLLVGGVAGTCLAAFVDRQISHQLQWQCGIATIVVILVCWMMAFS